MSRWISAILTFLAMSACQPGAEGTRDLGELSLGLSTQAGGHTYRLTRATLNLTGPIEEEIAVEGDDPLQRTLPVGSYTLELRPGWELSRIEADKLTPVEATLESQNPAQFVIGPGATSELALRFALKDGTPIAMGTGTLDVSVSLAEDDAGTSPEASCVSGLTINEVDYEQTGADTAEFVEILNLAGCAAELGSVNLELVNGGDGKTYATVKLSGAGVSLAPGARLVVGSESVLSALPAGVLRAPLASSGLQNGAPDAVRLVAGTQILDAFSYEGQVASASEGPGAGADDGEGAFGRCPDGFDTQNNSENFRLTTATPGTVNRCE